MMTIIRNNSNNSTEKNRDRHPNTSAKDSWCDQINERELKWRRDRKSERGNIQKIIMI